MGIKREPNSRPECKAAEDQTNPMSEQEKACLAPTVHTAGTPRKRSAVRARALAASTSRLRGGELVTSDSSSSEATLVSSSTAWLNAASFDFAGLLKPLSFLTN